MKRLIIGFATMTMLLTGCEEQKPETYSQTEGKVIDKDTTSGRFGSSYYISVSYPTGENNKYSIDDSDVSKEVYDTMKIGDKVTVYFNRNGVGKIVK